MQALPRTEWTARAAAHERRVDAWVQHHLERRRRGEKHPVHDFLFTYYSQRPAALRRWHPGFGTVLLDAPEYSSLKAYARIVHDVSPASVGVSSAERRGLSVAGEYLTSQRRLVEGVRRLLATTASRPPTLGCFGLHEWAMVHAGDSSEDRRRHDWPLRLGQQGTDAVVESHRITCSHFDAFRFFTESARPLNTLSPGRDDREAFEQPGCLHAGMDLYKHAFRLSPLVPSELVADCFALARDIRELDMRASPYDFSALGYEPVRIETIEGKQEYVAAQRASAQRGAPLRQRLVDECDRLLEAMDDVAGNRMRVPGERRTVGAMADQDVVDRFVQGGRLVIMPTKRSKRLLVLDHVAQSFEPGRTYPEAEVNAVLRGFHDDYAALRRYLVDEMFLTREGGIYWRSGGTV